MTYIVLSGTLNPILNSILPPISDAFLSANVPVWDQSNLNSWAWKGLDRLMTFWLSRSSKVIGNI